MKKVLTAVTLMASLTVYASASPADLWEDAYTAQAIQDLELTLKQDLPDPVADRISLDAGDLGAGLPARPDTMVAVGDAASSFALPDLSENEVTFDYGSPASPFYGKTTVMAFFASWCSHCQTELPYLEKLYEKSFGFEIKQ